MPNEHALLSASSASRWLACTAAPRFELQFPESTSPYAEEGRLAHEICELKVRKRFTNALTKKQYTTRLNKLKKDPRYSEEMDRTSETYLEHLVEKAMGYDAPPYVDAEVRMDFSEYVPDGFGTCDCVMIGGDTLNIIDYKHGKGVSVSAQGNAQMRLYALGALTHYAPFYGNVTQVCMAIDQPRVREEPDSETLAVGELREWGESIKPRAQLAFSGFGEFQPGEHCRFCRGKAQCRTRADNFTALEDFKDVVLPTPDEHSPDDAQILTLAEIGDLLVRGKNLVQWYADLEKFALEALLHGEEIDGWRCVAGRSNRTFSDLDAAIAAVISSGYDEALVYDRKPKTLTELEKLMGKKDFAETVGGYVIKPPGKPTLAPLSDKREPYRSAAADFAGVQSG